MKAILGVVVLTLVAAWTGEAVAQGGAPAGYREAIQEALAEHGAGNFEEARALFKRAHGLSPNARTLRGIGMAEYELRNYDDCILALEEALRSQIQPLVGNLRAKTEELLTKAQNFVARVNLELQPSTATVFVDGAPVTLGQDSTLMLRVGDHVLEFQAEGRLPERRELRVNGGEEQTMRIVLSEQVAATSTPTPSNTTSSNPPSSSTSGVRVTTERRVAEIRVAAPESTTHDTEPRSASPVPWILAGVSGAVLVTGVVLVALAQSDIAKVEDARDPAKWPELEGAYDRAPIMSGIGITLIGLGAAGAVTGVVLALTGNDRDSQTTPQVAFGLGNLSVTGTF